MKSSFAIRKDDKEFEVCFEPVGDPIVRELPGGGFVVGYLSQDEDCANPLESGDGMGKIVDRRNCGRRDTEDWEDCCRKPLTCILDRFSHGGDVWSLAGGGTQCQWDTSHNAGAWLPDEACLEHIKCTARLRMLPEGTKVEYKTTKNPDGTVDDKNLNVITWTLPDGRSKGGYKSFLYAIRGAKRVLLGVPENIPVRFAHPRSAQEKIDLAAKEREVAFECAEQALSVYNAWLSGECYGVCVEKFDAAGERTHDEACWGYVGDDARTVLEQDVENVMRDAAKLQGEANVETVVEEFVVGASIEVLESLATI